GFGCCAGGKCQTQHDNGVQGSYFDCDPIGTYNSSHAYAAALSANPAGNPWGSMCTGATGSGESQTVYCTYLPRENCPCWPYAALGVSRMWIGYVGVAAAANCLCPSPAGSVNHQWN